MSALRYQPTWPVTHYWFQPLLDDETKYGLDVVSRHDKPTRERASRKRDYKMPRKVQVHETPEMQNHILGWIKSSGKKVYQNFSIIVKKRYMLELAFLSCNLMERLVQCTWYLHETRLMQIEFDITQVMRTESRALPHSNNVSPFMWISCLPYLGYYCVNIFNDAVSVDLKMMSQRKKKYALYRFLSDHRIILKAFL